MASRPLVTAAFLPAIAVLLTVTLPASADHRIGLADLDRLQREGPVIVVDVRDEDAYRKAHVPRAVSIPLDQLEARATALRAAGATVVTYCGGPVGEKGARAAARLRELGVERAYALDGGLHRWLDSGRVVVVEPSEG